MCIYSKHKPKKKKRKKERKKVHEVSTSLVLLSFLLGSPIFKFFLFIYLFYLFIYLFIYVLCFIFLMVFFQTHVWIFAKPTTMRNYIHTHCCKSYSEKDKHIAVNPLSSGETGSYSKEHTKNKQTNKQTKYKTKYNTTWFSQESLKNSWPFWCK